MTANYHRGLASLSLSDDSVPISALQHWLYCQRQCALIHIERYWAENRFTAEGKVLHSRADGGGGERRGAVNILRAVRIASQRLGLHGVADVVEMRGMPPEPFPVEYKRGRPKAHRADEVQLCAQALCLEEMCHTDIAGGALFYGQDRRRKPVSFDAGLRSLTEQTANEVRSAISDGTVPSPFYEPRKCNTCSLKDHCQPERLQSPPQVSTWLSRMISSDAVPE